MVTEYLAIITRLGKHKAHLQLLVFKQKWLAKDVEDRKKICIIVGDLKVKRNAKSTFAPTVVSNLTRLLLQNEVIRGAHRTTKYIGGAYLFGKPTPPEAPDGHALFVRAPKGFSALGVAEADNQRRPVYFEVVDNLPGRQDVGRIWVGCYDELLQEEPQALIGVVFTPPVVDQRVYCMVRGGGLI